MKKLLVILIAVLLTACTPSAELQQVDRVIDGDTLIVAGDRVRLFAIDAPEIGEPGADRATAKLRELAGSGVYLERHGFDRFGRVLACVYTSFDNQSIDNYLIAGGFARPWIGASCEQRFEK